MIGLIIYFNQNVTIDIPRKIVFDDDIVFVMNKTGPMEKCKEDKVMKINWTWTIVFNMMMVVKAIREVDE